MAQIFPEWINRLPKILCVAALLLGAAGVALIWYYASMEFTDVGYTPLQPVPFSHKQHAGDLGLDCRFCHNTVEQARFAAVPPLEHCQRCHKFANSDSPKLELVRKSMAADRPLAWSRVHLLPDHAFFHHGAHYAAGIGCVTCHGRVDQMEEVSQVETLGMTWCLDCHQRPKAFLRPVGEVCNMEWDAAGAGLDPQRDLARSRALAPPTHCSGCHQ